MPSLSIITPSYNQGSFIEETLRSVIAQREQVHEYFVIDGGSTDGSTEIIRRYAPSIDYWVSEKDSGQSDAIHKGFLRATGDVLLWLNSDDVLLPGALAKVRAAFDRHGDWDVLTGWHLHIDAQSRILACNRIPGESPGWARWGVHHVCQQTCFFKRKLYQQVGGLRLDLHCVMDTELWYRFFDAGAHWGHLPAYLGGFRIHSAAKGRSWLQQYAAEHRLLDAQWPDYHSGSLKHRAGQWMYRAQQLLSPMRLAGAIQTRRLRGQALREAFGPVRVPTSSGAACLP